MALYPSNDINALVRTEMLLICLAQLDFSLDNDAAIAHCKAGKKHVDNIQIYFNARGKRTIAN